MGFNRELYNRAQAEISRRHAQAETAANALRVRILSTYPRARECEKQLLSCASQIASAYTNGGDIQSALKIVQEKNLKAQKELAAILQEAGESVSDFTPQYTCKKCNDTGIYNHGFCDCLTDLMKQYASERFNKTSHMDFTSLDDMDLNYYSAQFDNDLGITPRDHMQDILEYCRCYGDNFDTHSDSLLLFGTTGTGKTHTALALAHMASQKGFTTLYHTAQQIFHQLERDQFGQTNTDTETLLCDCDLLILDDIGTEMTTKFTISALYSIINTRMLKNLPTIISTNLSPTDWQERYGEAIASRVLGTFQPLLFVGKDIRQQKIERHLNEH